MKSSCIAHPENEPLLVIRQWQLDACDGNHCAAALLSFFEYWHNIKLDQQGQAEKANRIAEMHGDAATQDTSLLQFHNADELQAGILGLYGAKSIEKSIPFLIDKGFISLHSNPNPRYHFDKTRYILFHPAAVNLYLQEKVRDRSRKNALPSRKNALPSRKNALPSRKNAEPIPEISSEISSETFSPNPINGGQNALEVAMMGTIAEASEEHTVCSGDESSMVEMTQELPKNSRAHGTNPRAVAARQQQDARQLDQEQIAACPHCDATGRLLFFDATGIGYTNTCPHDLPRILGYVERHRYHWPHAPPGATDHGPAP